jgi:hypothetical protein
MRVAPPGRSTSAAFSQCFSFDRLLRHNLSRLSNTSSDMAHLDKRVDGENNKLGLRLGIVHQVQIDKLLLLQVVCLLLESVWPSLPVVVIAVRLRWYRGERFVGSVPYS